MYVENSATVILRVKQQNSSSDEKHSATEVAEQQNSRIFLRWETFCHWGSRV